MQQPDKSQESSIPHVRVIGKAVKILNALADGAGDKTLSEICRQVEMNRSTTYRILATLEFHRLVHRNTETGAYSLGIKLLEMGISLQKSHTVASTASPHMRQLADRVGASVFLSSRDLDRAVCLERVDRGDVQIVRYQVGETLPLTVGASQFVLLAALDDKEIDTLLQAPIPSFTKHTVTDPGAVQERIRRVREEGLAWSIEDVVMTMASFGCPIVGPRGNTVAALSVATHKTKLLGEMRAKIVDETLSTAREISQELGYAGSWPCIPLPPAAN